MNSNKELKEIEEMVADKKFEGQAIEALKFGDDGLARFILARRLYYLSQKSNLGERTLFTFLYELGDILAKGKEFEKVKSEREIILQNSTKE